MCWLFVLFALFQFSVLSMSELCLVMLFLLFTIFFVILYSFITFDHVVVPSEFILYTNKFFVDTHLNTEYIVTGFEVLLVEYVHGGRVVHVTKYILG